MLPLATRCKDTGPVLRDVGLEQVSIVKWNVVQDYRLVHINMMIPAFDCAGFSSFIRARVSVPECCHTLVKCCSVVSRCSGTVLSSSVGHAAFKTVNYRCLVWCKRPGYLLQNENHHTTP